MKKKSPLLRTTSAKPIVPVLEALAKTAFGTDIIGWSEMRCPMPAYQTAPLRTLALLTDAYGCKALMTLSDKVLSSYHNKKTPNIIERLE